MSDVILCCLVVTADTLGGVVGGERCAFTPTLRVSEYFFSHSLGVFCFVLFFYQWQESEDNIMGEQICIDISSVVCVSNKMTSATVNYWHISGGPPDL